MLRKIRTDHPELDGVPIVMLTAKADDQIRVELLRAGAQDYLLKPFSSEELRARVGNLVAMKRAQSGLQQTMKELESFSYSVSHDLRAPLRAIQGFSKILIEDHEEALGAEGRRLAGTIMEGATRMSTLIDSLLEFSRLGRKELVHSSVDMAVLAREVLGEVLEQAPERRIETQVGDLPPISGDRTLLRQVWVNLLGNAVKYTGRRALAHIEVGASAGADRNTYWVKDDGAGFSMDRMDKLFGVFHRLHSEKEFPGTGVGLALVHRIIERHGGTIKADAAPDQGAKFTFTLPV
jgi:light-regulated signal transduction histidine kinase (bacteriophytochrome)